jgi:hypothetical protein
LRTPRPAVLKTNSGPSACKSETLHKPEDRDGYSG